MRSRAFGFWGRAVEAAVLAVAICFSIGATNASSRLDFLDHRLMCACGCAQVLGECNHVGCTQSAQELTELRADIAAGMSNQQIFDSFVAKYGATVLAAPPAKGLNLVAWIAPFAVFFAALVGTTLLIFFWARSDKKTQMAAAGRPQAVSPVEQERLMRIRRETSSEEGN